MGKLTAEKGEKESSQKIAMIARVRNGIRRRSGQAMTEFVLVAGVTIMFFFILAIFLNAYLENQYRVLSLLSSQYP